MSMLERLQGQAQSFDSIANRGSEAINNFDLQEQMYSGAELAYRMGHEQLNALVGGEVVQGLHQGLPVVYRTARAVGQRAGLVDMNTRTPTGAGRTTTTPPGAREPPDTPPQPPAAPSYGEATANDPPGYDSSTFRTQTETITQPAADNRDTQGLFDRESRNFRYNTDTRRIETEGGEEPNFGDSLGLSTTVEQQEAAYDPIANQRPVSSIGGQVNQRANYDEVDMSTRGANQRASAREITRRQQEAKAKADAEEPSAAEPEAEIPVGQRAAPGEFTGTQDQAASYTRSGNIRVAPKVESSIPYNEAAPDPGPVPEGVSRFTQRLAEAQAEAPAPTGDVVQPPSAPGLDLDTSRLENIADKYKNAPQRSLGEVAKDDPTGSYMSDEQFAAVNKRLAAAREPAAPTDQDLADRLGRLRGDVPSNELPSDEELTARLNKIRGYDAPEPLPSTGQEGTLAASPPSGSEPLTAAKTSPYPELPAELPTGPPQQAALQSQSAALGDEARGLTPGQRPPAPPEPAAAPKPTAEDPLEEEFNETMPGGLKILEPELDPGTVPSGKGITPPVDDPDEDEGADVLKNIGKAEADVLPEEEFADAIPGVGEIIGGLIGIGAALFGVAEASKSDPPPKQPAGIPAMSTAFDSAPVIDSDQYHQL